MKRIFNDYTSSVKKQRTQSQYDIWFINKLSNIVNKDKLIRDPEILGYINQFVTYEEITYLEACVYSDDLNLLLDALCINKSIKKINVYVKVNTNDIYIGNITIPIQDLMNISKESKTLLSSFIV